LGIYGKAVSVSVIEIAFAAVYTIANLRNVVKIRSFTGIILSLGYISRLLAVAFEMLLIVHVFIITFTLSVAIITEPCPTYIIDNITSTSSADGYEVTYDKADTDSICGNNDDAHASDEDTDDGLSGCGSDAETLLQPRILFFTASEFQLVKCVSRRHLLTINAVSQWIDEWLVQATTADKNSFVRVQPISNDYRDWADIMSDFEQVDRL
jgi:hypothetical protein